MWLEIKTVIPGQKPKVVGKIELDAKGNPKKGDANDVKEEPKKGDNAAPDKDNESKQPSNTGTRSVRNKKPD